MKPTHVTPEKISCIVPNYNHEKYLLTRIQSIFEQTKPIDELIFLDDASTDQSVPVWEQWQKENNYPQIKISQHLNTENSGSSSLQWEKGIEFAEGSAVWLAESDDWADPKFLSELTNRFAEEVGIVYCASHLVDESGQKIEPPKRWREIWSGEPWNRDFVMNGAEFAQKYMLIHNMIPNASAVLIRKSLWDSIPLDKARPLRLNGDWLRWLQLLPHTKIAYIAEPLNHFRWHDQSQREQTRKDFADIHELYYVMSKGMNWNNVSFWRRQKTWSFLLLSFLYRLFRIPTLSLTERFSQAKSEAEKAREFDRYAPMRLSLLFIPYALWETLKKIMKNR